MHYLLHCVLKSRELELARNQNWLQNMATDGACRQSVRDWRGYIIQASKNVRLT